ncbi:MAG TPA: NAD(P)H-dependent glycerol-3-phosphate dehydrogenase [Vicinamibacterales bacterium]|jgi:glycerol-3-phosphate dehydrogenase (NAD(P)+)|nr:NAD(P)H-dependent glycerol-3-phosphate dehydrogenase [Vicinamibacterales bacterium]
MPAVTVLGAGSWGTALAVHLGRIGHDVRLWARDAALAREMAARRANAIYLPDVRLPPNVSVTAAIAEALHQSELVIAAIPSHGCRAVVRKAAPHIAPRAVLVSAMKGLEADTLLRMSEVIAQEVGPARPVVALSGPSFAAEVAQQLPTAVLAASLDAEATKMVQAEFRSPYFRLYGSDDVIGVEIGGALKNIIAIAAGVVEGLGLGHNALAALITRGLAELTRLACAAGGRRETLAGLSGLGDLVLTCTGNLSRNRYVGVELARGRPLADILAGMKMIAEGVRTTGAALALGERHHVELPIATQMAEVLAGRSDVRTAIETLMLRRQRAEHEVG